MLDKVSFRIFPEGDVIAIFPDIPESGGCCMSYMQIGQHGGAHLDLLKDLEPATPKQYADIRAELERIGYELDVQTEAKM